VVTGLFVVGVGIVKMSPVAFFIYKRYLGEHFIAYIDAMRVVFCRGEDEFGGFDEARVEVDGAGQGQVQQAGEVLFKKIGGVFYIGEVAGVEESIDSDELAEDIWAGLVFVVVGLCEGPDVACEVDLAYVIDYCLSGGSEGVLISGEDADYEFNGFWVCEFPHQ